MGSGQEGEYPNTIIDEGKKSTSGIVEIVNLSEVLGQEEKLDEVRAT